MKYEYRVSGVCVHPTFFVVRDKQKTTPFREWSFEYQSRLGERDIGSCRTLLALSHFKSDSITNLEFVVGNTYELLGVEEEILLHTVAGDESKSTWCERFDSSVHSFASVLLFERNPTTFPLALIAKGIVA